VDVVIQNLAALVEIGGEDGLVKAVHLVAVWFG